MTRRDISLIRPLTLGIALSAAVTGAQAKVGADQVARLDTDLTPLGATRIGNADNSIPAWVGGLTQGPANADSNKHEADPFADEKALFTIDKANVDKYTEKLSRGQQQLIQQYAPGYVLNVYPSHRTAAYPDWIYDTLKKNAATAELIEDGNGVRDTIASSPFPIPKDGLEAVWNHILRFRGEQVYYKAAFASPTTTGSFTPVLTEYSYYFTYSEPGVTLAGIDNKIFYLQTEVLSPAKLAGTLNLVHETLDQIRSPRQAWRYQAGERRLRLAPTLAYETDMPNSEGLRTVDQKDMYNGSPSQYNWRLLGKKEIYVPYNAYKLHSSDVKTEQIIRPKHINQDLARYELHRVWVVEGALREGLQHIYHRRMFYLDEDSWQILLTEEYDRDGNLWRVSEAHPVQFYGVPTLWTTNEMTYDLKSERYFIDGLDNEEKPFDFHPGFEKKDFTTAAARRKAKR